MNVLRELFFLGIYAFCLSASANRVNLSNTVTKNYFATIKPNFHQVKIDNFGQDSTLIKEVKAYRMKQIELLKRLTSIEEAKKIVQNDVVRYAQYKNKDTLEIIRLWINEFKTVTKLPDDRVKSIEQAIRNKVGSGHFGGNSILNSLDMYCLDVLLLNMTAIEYGNYSKDVQLLHRWLASKASDKLYMYYKNDLKLTDNQIRDTYKALFTSP